MQHLFVSIYGYKKDNSSNTSDLELIQKIADNLAELGVDSFDFQINGSQIYISYHPRQGVEAKIHLTRGALRVIGNRHDYDSKGRIAKELGEARNTTVEVTGNFTESILEALMNLCNVIE